MEDKGKSQRQFKKIMLFKLDILKSKLNKREKFAINISNNAITKNLLFCKNKNNISVNLRKLKTLIVLLYQELLELHSCRYSFAQ